MVSVRVTEEGDYALQFGFNRALVEDLKSYIPSHQRTWDKETKTWIISAAARVQAEQIIKRYFPVIFPQAISQKVQKSLKVLYIAQTKGVPAMAYGYTNGAWSVIFPEALLRAWFSDTRALTASESLYVALGVSQSILAADMKAAYRRMALQWHPDRCKEPDAKERFIRIQQAYEVLSDPNQRRKYDAGLALEALAPKQQDNLFTDEPYRTPLRCGEITVEAVRSAGKLLVEKIISWDDIRDSAGRTLVTHWPKGADMFKEEWA